MPSAPRPEHVAAHDVDTRVDDPVDLGAVLLGVVDIQVCSRPSTPSPKGSSSD
jgi:hypothetical protein